MQSELSGLGLEELIRREDRREWNEPEDWLYMARAVNARIRNYYNNIILVSGKLSRRETRHIRSVMCVGDFKEALSEALKRHGNKAQITVLHDANATLPLETVHHFELSLWNHTRCTTEVD